MILYSNLPDNADINNRLVAGDVTRQFNMSQRMIPGPGGGFEFTINDLVYDETVVNEILPRGATEIWNITNTSNMAHPFHAHAIQWQILSRGVVDIAGNQVGNTITASGIDLGWKDTVLVQPFESVQFIGRFDPVINVGVYMYHCHILEHEDNGMMGIFEIK